MKTITSILIILILLPVLSFSQVGTPDSNFNHTGVTYHPQGSANTIVIQKDGKIVVGGSSLRGFTLVRYGIGGIIDKTFGIKGTAYFYTGPDNATVKSIAIQPDGKIVAVGTDTTNFAVKRFNVNGTLDSSFGVNGQVSTAFQNLHSIANYVTIQPDNKILAVGSADYDYGEITKIALARYNTDGSSDSNFGVKGKATKKFVSWSIEDIGTSLILQPGNKIIVAGVSAAIRPLDFALARYKSNGNIDKSFGDNGFAVLDFDQTYDYLNAAAVQSNGKIIVAGYIINGPSVKIALARFTKNGHLDSTFGSNGKVIADFYGLDSRATGIVIQPDDKIVISAAVDSVNGFGVARFTKKGLLDNSFGNGGKVITQIFDEAQYTDEANSLTLQSNGKIVVAGTSGGYFSVVRYKNDATTLNLTADNSDLKIANNGFASIKLFPNPVKDIVHISGVANSSIAVYNTQGKLVLQTNAASETCDLNVRFLPAGVYYLQIISVNKKSITLNFIKQ